MSRLASAALLLFALQFGLAHAGNKQAKASGFYDLSAESIEGKKTKLSEYKGQLLLVVNTASKCGYTKQYEGLQSLYSKYKDQGFVVLGFPSNDFGSQEPGANGEIKSFCKVNFGVNFPLFAKAPVTGKDKQPVYKFLTEQSPEPLRGEVAWNFEKFLVNGQGEVVARFKSGVEPSNEELQKKIAEALPRAKQ